MSNYYWFNRNPVELGQQVEEVKQDLIEATPNLRRASLENALLFGGPLVRQCLEVAPLEGDREHILVDTKVSFLMKGWYPAIPGWHTDGVPRMGCDGTFEQGGSGLPSLPEQDSQSLRGYFPRYHTIHVGVDCATEFLDGLLWLPILDDLNDGMYSEMTWKINGLSTLRKFRAAEGCWHSWDWWNVHQATASEGVGWRLLIRVTESDMPPAERDFVRAQNQVYVPENFGW